MVEDMTARTIDLTPSLIPNGSHWRLPHANWVQQQQQASQERIKRSSWWGELFRGPARLLGLVDDSLQGVEPPNAGQHVDCMASWLSSGLCHVPDEEAHC